VYSSPTKANAFFVLVFYLLAHTLIMMASAISSFDLHHGSWFCLYDKFQRQFQNMGLYMTQHFGITRGGYIYNTGRTQKPGSPRTTTLKSGAGGTGEL
jgi:hypothetical protein